ncbi:TRAP-type mannitol/chloroaromatic compound transport system permease small subunit [Palleronia aestuarii]|uniref:TRAP transporter small permease protein n=1 Tax=Palleronia aestuarii TaxID=568105 RepID=A0A2W7N1C9_9RHOB|nr:TRAP transporter small permease subunit [Palleronia aestuarii]PZX13791.1 TRAP-type mannitol/chloroaromatic compound transport system permease small subunit [Palleronia aestuarii]
MNGLLSVSQVVDRVTGWIGRTMAWLLLLAVIVSAGNAVIRKSFNLSSNAWLELQWYLFGAVFMLCAAWTLREDEHVRVDVLSQRLSTRSRVWIDLVCHILFLMPFAILMTYLSWPFVVSSFLSGEQSNNAGGLIRWPAKLWILAGFALLVAQGVSEIIKRGAMLTGHLPMPEESGAEDDLPPAAREAGARDA